MRVLRCHVGHTMKFHRPLPSAVLLRKFTIVSNEKVEHISAYGGLVFSNIMGLSVVHPSQN